MLKSTSESTASTSESTASTSESTADQWGRIALTMKETASAIGVCERTVWQLIRDGHLKAAKIGRSVRIRIDELDRFINDAEA